MSRLDTESTPDLSIIHYCDPWCWFSWGLEPVLQRLHEVYREGIKITYKTGGVFEDFDEWRAKYGVEDDKALMEWIEESDQTMRNPFNVNYALQCAMKSTDKACVAFKAAQLQGEEHALKFYRKLMEAIQIRAEDGSSADILKRIAEKSGLDLKRFSKDLDDKRTFSMFKDDRHDMAASKGNFFSLVIVSKKTGERRQVSGYTSDEYEAAIDQMSKGVVTKRTPIDMIEYLDARRGLLVTTHEICEVFKIDEGDAERRLSGLTATGLLKRIDQPDAGHYWFLPEDKRLAELTLHQVELSHVTEHARVSEPAKLQEVVRTAVQRLYTEVAEKPRGNFHFPVGREGTKVAGYPGEELDIIPATAVESFAGVGYPHGTNSIRKGDIVLDVGSGSGTDVLVASLRTGPEGKVIGLDMTDAMIAKARANVEKSGLKNIKIIKGDATELPLDDSSVDVVTSNGVLNLVPDKQKAFNEIFRVLKAGGRLQLADIVVQEDVQAVCGIVPQLWADCIGGAAVERDYLETIRSAGFTDVGVVGRVDYFSKSPESIRRLTKTFDAESVVISARKPLRKT